MNISMYIVDHDNPINTPPATTPHSCQDGYTPYWYGCYKVFTDNTTWALAEAQCVNDGGHLASVQSEAENAAIFLAGGDEKGMFPQWIGLKGVSYMYFKIC